MDRKQTLAIMSVIKAAYPAYYKGMAKEAAESVVDLWQDMFEGEDAGAVALAVKALIACDTKGFPPVIGQVKEYLRKLGDSQELTELQAWELLKKHLRKIDRYAPSKSFAQLPEVIQRCVGSPQTMAQWAVMDVSQLENVVASSFMRTYRTCASREQEYEKLPPSVQKRLKALSQGADQKALQQGAE